MCITNKKHRCMAAESPVWLHVRSNIPKLTTTHFSRPCPQERIRQELTKALANQERDLPESVSNKRDASRIQEVPSTKRRRYYGRNHYNSSRNSIREK